jgi:hypothetical protein
MSYFDLGLPPDAMRPQSSTTETTPLARWIPQYLALFAGILLQKFFTAYLETGAWQLKGFWGWFAAALVLGLMGFPAVYRRSLDPEKPLPVQLCVIFTAGMGWQSIVKVGGTIGAKLAQT